MEEFDNVAKQVRKNALNAVQTHLNENLPGGLKFQIPNPADAEEAQPEEEDVVDVDAEGDDDVDDIGSLVWEDADADHNLECAVAAWRAAGLPGTLVAFHKGGAAFFGVAPDLDEYIDTHDLKDSDWNVIDDAGVLLTMPYDLDAMKTVLKMLDTTEYADAQEVYEQFHWGDSSNVTVVKQVTGLNAPLVHLGVGRRIEYGAKKDGKFEEYFHMFGEDSGKFPQVYAVMDPEQKFPIAILIQGGEMRVEPRGIVE